MRRICDVMSKVKTMSALVASARRMGVFNLHDSYGNGDPEFLQPSCRWRVSVSFAAGDGSPNGDQDKRN